MVENPKHIVYGEKLTPIPVTNIAKHFLQQFEIHKEKIALVDGATREEIRYSKLLDNVKRLAITLKQHGLNRGDIVGICSENSVYYLQIVLAALIQGIIITTFNSEYIDRELDHCMNLSKPKVVLCSSSVSDRITNVAHHNTFIKKVIVICNDESNKTTTTTLLQQVSSVKQQQVNKFTPDNLTPDDNAFVLYSSGTTGLPKGVLLSHGNILAFLAAQTSEGFLADIGVALGYLPLFHAYGLMSGIFLLQAGGTYVILPRFAPDLFLKCIQDYKIKTLTGVPPIINFMAKHPMVDNYDLSSLTNVGCGAAPLSKELEELFLKRFKFVDRVRQGYGMSELTLGVLMVPLSKYKPGSTGIVISGMKVKIVDPETGDSKGPNDHGEICVNGPMVMKGYIGNETATRSIIDKQGWLHTGDIGYYDEEGWFFIVDRLKELIKYKGFQVAPAELEALLQSHPAVLDAAVIGVPDDEAGEIPKAFIVKQKPVTEQELVDFIKGQVSTSKRLRGGVEFVDVIPKNPSGKILRRELRTRVNKTKSKL